MSVANGRSSARRTKAKPAGLGLDRPREVVAEVVGPALQQGQDPSGVEHGLLPGDLGALLEQRRAGEGVRGDRQRDRGDQRDQAEEEGDLGAQTHLTATGHGAKCGRVSARVDPATRRAGDSRGSPLPVRHQGEEGTPPGQRERSPLCKARVTARAQQCAICVTSASALVGISRARMLPAVHSLLFIEDDDQIRLALKLALEDEGYQVREAPDGATGLAAFDGAGGRPRAARPAPARHVRLRRLPIAARPQHRADHHDHGPDRHVRPGRRAGGRRRRLHHEAGDPQGAGGADPGAAAAGPAAGDVGAAGVALRRPRAAAAIRGWCARRARS